MSEVLAGQREREKVAPFTAAYFGSLRNRSCINKEYPQSPTTVPIAIPFHLQLCTAFPSPLYSSLFLFSPTVPPRRLKLSRRDSSFYSPDASLPPRALRNNEAPNRICYSPVPSYEPSPHPAPYFTSSKFAKTVRACEFFYIFIKQLNSLPDETAYSVLARRIVSSETRQENWGEMKKGSFLLNLWPR